MGGKFSSPDSGDRLELIAPMSRLKKLQKLLRAKLGVSDSTLAEYVLSVSAGGAAELQRALAGFPSDLVERIVAIALGEPFEAANSVAVEPDLRLELESGTQTNNGCRKTLKPGHPPAIVVDRKIPSFLQTAESKTTDSVTNADFQPKKSWLVASASHTSQKMLAEMRMRDSELVPSVLPKPAQTKGLAASPKLLNSLPVHQFRQRILNAVSESSVVIVVGDTGSGKTTQITQFLNAAGYSAARKMIACTQPRRLAAISVAERVANEVDGSPVGGRVGYSVRFDDCTSINTEIKYMTDGLLLREILADPQLDRYAAIMLDEAHERTIATDVLFALLKSLVTRRPELRIIVTSATLDAPKFAAYFGGAPILHIPGRTFPVKIAYQEEPKLDYLESAVEMIDFVHTTEALDEKGGGDILVFLTGQAEIENVLSILEKRYPKKDLYAVPVYAAIPSEMQSLIFDPAPVGKRKVVLATNIAETSLTIDGIRYVIDPGFAKVQVWDPKRGMGVLKVQPISQAQANQRAGRAGRTAPGVCYRLYTEQSFANEMPKSAMPEILRADLGYTVLMLKSMGIDDVLEFDFMDPPPKQALVASLEELYLLGAIDEHAGITAVGEQMAKFPLEPTLAKTVVSAIPHGKQVLNDVLTVIAMLSMPSVFYRPTRPPAKKLEAERAHQRFYNSSGDHITLLNVYQHWVSAKCTKKWCDQNFLQFKTLLKVRDALRQLGDIVQKGVSASLSLLNSSKPLAPAKYQEEVLKALCSGLYRNVAKAQAPDGMSGSSFTTLDTNTAVAIHPSSVLYKKSPPYLIYTSLILTSREYMHTVSQIQPEWLLEAAPDAFRWESEEEEKKRQRTATITPLFNRFSRNPDEWRVSKHHETLRSSRRK